jgi:hypothetical protein
VRQELNKEKEKTQIFNRTLPNSFGLNKMTAHGQTVDDLRPKVNSDIKAQ